MTLAKCANKLIAKSLNYKKILCYQHWKKLTLKSEGSSNVDRIIRIFSELITSSEDFNRCVENDCYLSQIVSEKLRGILHIASSDILFFMPIE